jgi:MFS family permease
MFGPFVVANLISNAGNWFQVIGSVLLVYDLTRSARMVSLVSVTTFGAFLVLSPVAGAVSDRVDRRRLLMVSQGMSSFLAATLAIWAALGIDSPWPVIGLTGLLAVSNVFSIPAMLALVPSLVPARDLPGAIALNTVGINLARVAGPALAAVTVSRYGPAAAFGVNSLSFVVLTVVLLVLVRPPTRTAVQTPAADRSIRAGYRYLGEHRESLLLFIGIAAIGASMDPTSTLAPPLAASFGGGDTLVGGFVSAFGIGAVVASMIRRRLALVGSLRSDVAGLLVCAAGLLGLAASPGRVAAIASFALLGSGYLIGLTDITTQIQRRVPDVLLGRIMGVWSQVLLGARPIAAAVMGFAADAWSPHVAALVLSIVPIVATHFVRKAPAAASLDPVDAIT